jgi:hypothetical protein
MAAARGVFNRARMKVTFCFMIILREEDFSDYARQLACSPRI